MEAIIDDLKQMKMERYENHLSKDKELSSNSLRTYGSIVKKLFREVFKGVGDLKPKLFIDGLKKVVKFLDDHPLNQRRNLYTALYSYTNHQVYQKLMSSNVKDYMEGMKKQTCNKQR